MISNEFPDALLACRKRYQTVHPELGIAHACNDAFLPLMKFCTRYRDYNWERPALRFDFHESLVDAVGGVRFRPCTAEQTRSYQKINAFMELYQDPDFVQINNFILDFRRWVEGGFGDRDRREGQTVQLEPFQKNLLIHVIFFIAVTKLPTLANRVLEYLLYVFNIDFVSEQSLHLFKQKATVFLVPRRHGKTWFMIPIICFLLKNILGISIGYVAHQKHVSQFVLKEVEFRCRRMFGASYVVENKDNVISMDHKVAKSTALFASCYNTNVSAARPDPYRVFSFLLLSSLLDIFISLLSSRSESKKKKRRGTRAVEEEERENIKICI